MPGAMWYETGPKERSEEGDPHFSAFVWSPLVQQQWQKPLLPLVPFSSETERLHWPCQMWLCIETSSEQHGWKLNQTESKFPCSHEEISEQVKINHDAWVNFFHFSSLNRVFQSTAIQTMSVELLSRDESVFSQCTSELSGVKEDYLKTPQQSKPTFYNNTG